MLLSPRPVLGYPAALVSDRDQEPAPEKSVPLVGGVCACSAVMTCGMASRTRRAAPKRILAFS